MGYLIMCPKGCCSLWAENVAELLNHRDEHCLFMCPCGHNGYVEKSFNLQDKHFGPVLRGAISLGQEDETYWPFVYFVSDKPDGKIDDLWFAYYYKGTRVSCRSLNVGYGPGRPPILSTNQVHALQKKVEELAFITGTAADVIHVIGSPPTSGAQY